MAGLSEADKKACLDAFTGCDFDNSNSLTLNEILYVVRALGWEEDVAKDEDIKKWFTDLGMDCDKGITQDQFLQAYGQSYLKDRRLAHLKKVFKSLDKNGDKKLSADELHGGFVQAGFPISKSDVESLLKNMSSDGNKFNIEEFVNFFRISSMFSETTE